MALLDKVLEAISKGSGMHSKQIYRQFDTELSSMSHLKHKILKQLQQSNAITKRHSLRIEPVNPSTPLPKLSNKSHLITLQDGTKAVAHSQWLWYSHAQTPPQFSQASASQSNVLPPHNSMRLEKKEAHAERVQFNRENREVEKVAPPKQLLDGFSVPRELHSAQRDSLSRQKQHDKVIKNLKFWQKQAEKVHIAEEAFSRGQQSAR